MELDDNISDSETVENSQLELGAPDFGDLIDDNDEITADDFAPTNAKAQKGLKPSYAIKKFMPMIFTVIAKRRGEHWMLDQEEVDELADAVDDCMEHYYPDAPNLPPWAMLVMAGGSIVLPRIMIDDLSDEEKQIVDKQLKELDDKTLSNEAQEPQPVGYNTVLRPKGVKHG